MSEPTPPDPNEIVILTERVSPETLRRLLAANYVDTVKFVADLRRQVIALGGVMHADAEAVLLETGSAQADLWGANYPPGERVWLQYTSLINIRPSQGHPSMEVADSGVREAIRMLVERLIGCGESL